MRPDGAPLPDSIAGRSGRAQMSGASAAWAVGRGRLSMEAGMPQDSSRNSPGRNGRAALGLLLWLSLCMAVAVFAPRVGHGGEGGARGAADDDKRAEQEIRRLYDREHELLLRRDFDAQERFYPDDFVVTNPFNMFINKTKVMERLRGDIIKYNKYEREYDYFRRYGETMVVVGSETVVPTLDAKRPDAGKTVHRRFTEVWVQRDGGWQKVVRHASNVAEP